jgi:hypothetical protein
MAGILNFLICTSLFVVPFLRAETAGGSGPSKGVDVEQRFSELLKEAVDSPSGAPFPAWAIEAVPAYRKMVALGPRCLPYLTAQLGTGKHPDPDLVYVAIVIMRVKEPVVKWTGDMEQLAQWVRQFGGNGYRVAKGAFPELRNRWETTKAKKGSSELWQEVAVWNDEIGALEVRRKLTPLGEIYRSIEAYGLFVLPLLMEEVKNGNWDFVPIIQAMIGSGEAVGLPGRAPARLYADACLQWWKESQAEWTVLLPPPPED